MELIVSVVNAAVVGVVGLILAWLGKARFDALEKRMERLEGRVDGLRDSFQASLDGIRSDLTQVALAVGARPKAGNA